MARFIFIRHGQSETNVTNCFAGQSNPSLTEKGLLQADLLAKWIAKTQKIDCIYSSDLTRAYQTASATAKKLGMKVVKDPAFREINAGLWQGVNYLVIKDNYKDIYDIWINDTINARLPEGESVKELGERIVAETLRLNEIHTKDETVMIFTHATPIRVVTTYFKDGNINDIKNTAWASNTSATVLNLNGETPVFELISFDDYLANETSVIPGDII